MLRRRRHRASPRDPDRNRDAQAGRLAPSTPPSPPTPSSASSSPPAAASAATASPSSGTRNSKNSPASPAPAARPNPSPSKPLAPAQKTAPSPPLGAISVSTPGALDGWWTLHQRYGKLKWAELFEPAIHYCETGVPHAADHRLLHQAQHGQLSPVPAPASKKPPTRCTPTRPTAKPPNEDDVRRNPDLARTYRIIAEGGRDAFYDGPIAKTIEAYFKRIGGWITVDDLRAQHAEWLDPIVTNYRGVDVYAMAANTQGLATLQLLNIAENFDLRNMGFQSAESLHVQIEAKRLAYEDRARYYADPHFAKIPIDWLNSKDYAKQRAKQIKLDRILDSHLSRPGPQPRRHHLLHRRRQRRHDGLA